jgi:hypothetical protein
MCPYVLLLGSALGPPELEKCCIIVSRLGSSRTLYVTHKSHQMKKHMLCVTCPCVLLLGCTPSPPEHEKCCIDIMHPGCTIAHYVTRRIHRMQKDKFDVTCPGALSVRSAWGPT